LTQECSDEDWSRKKRKGKGKKGRRVIPAGSEAKEKKKGSLGGAVRDPRKAKKKGRKKDLFLFLPKLWRGKTGQNGAKREKKKSTKTDLTSRKCRAGNSTKETECQGERTQLHFCVRLAQLGHNEQYFLKVSPKAKFFSKTPAGGPKGTSL